MLYNSIKLNHWTDKEIKIQEVIPLNILPAFVVVFSVCLAEANDTYIYSQGCVVI